MAVGLGGACALDLGNTDKLGGRMAVGLRGWSLDSYIRVLT